MNAASLRSAAYITSICGLYLASAMMVPALVDLHFGQRDWQVFALSGFLVGGICLMTALAMRGPTPPFNKRMGFLLVNLLWLMFSFVGAIPLYIGDYGLNFSQALFESASAITTTGSTVMVGLDHMAPGVLVWR